MKKSQQLSSKKRNSLIVVAIAELAFKAAAARDIHRRSAEQVRGPKRAWYAALAVNFFGPAAYFAFGRR